MTTTSERDDQTAAPQSRAASVPLRVPPKVRRRPSLVAGGVTAICLGALLAAWAWTSTTSSQEVLAARSTIHRGEVIEADDLIRVRINGDPAVSSVPASSYDAILGQRAALDIAAGGLLTSESTTAESVPSAGQSIVGISLPIGLVPSRPLHGGDMVRIVATPAEDGLSTADAGAPPSTSAIVVDARIDEASGNILIDVQVPHAEASVLAARAATGRVAVILDAGEQ